jgi:hypothetical protein
LSIVVGLLWDRPLVTFNGDSNYILSSNMLANIGEVTDLGYNNRFDTPRFKYQDRRSVSDYGDARSYHDTLVGELVFRDWIDGGKVSDKWVYSGVGSPVVISYTVTDSGASGWNLTKTRARLQTSTTTNDTAQITWGTQDVKTGQNVRLHATVLTGGGVGATEEAQVGLYQDANDHILFISDTTNARWICRTTVSGVATDQYITANFNRLQLLSIICDNSKVRFEQGEAAFGNVAIARGRYNMINSVTNTNNATFPINQSMAPLVLIKTKAASAGVLFLYDFQLLRSYSTKTI